MTVAPHIADWALSRIRADHRLSAELAACLRRIPHQPAAAGADRVLSAEPVSALIGLTTLVETVIGGSSIAIAGATITAASIGGAIVGVAASIGVNYALSAFSKPTGSAPISSSAAASGDAVNTPQAIQFVERQATPGKRIIYGTALVGGALFFESVKPPYLYQGIMLCAKKITAFRQVSISTQQISFPALLTNIAISPIAISGQPNYPGRLVASLRLGDPNQAIDVLLHADFPALSTTFRQRGIATAVMRYQYGTDFTEYTQLWGQASRPTPLFLVDGIAVPDPRKPGHILQYDPKDPAAVAAAEASWEWSNNAALVQAHFLTQRYGGRINPSRINWDKVAAAADWDDGAVLCNDGSSIKRHTIDGVVTLVGNQPSDIVSSMISANRGFVLQSAGRAWPSSSAPRIPVATIHDGLLTGAVEYRASKPKRDLANRVKTRFIAPDREYQEVDGPVLSRADLIAADGELLEVTLDLPFTQDSRRAQRLQKAFLENARLGRQLSCRCDIVLLADCSEDPIGCALLFNSSLFAMANGTYLCTDWGFADNFSSIDLALIEYDATIETDYRAAVDEQPFILAPLDLS